MSSPRKDSPEKKGKRSRPTVPVENQAPPPVQLSQGHIQAILDGVSKFRNVKRELADINEKLLKLHLLDILSSLRIENVHRLCTQGNRRYEG